MIDFPQIPVGLATKLGLILGALATLITAVLAILDGDHSQETLGAAVFAAANFVAVILGRSQQAAAVYAAAIQTKPAGVVPPRN
jgi:hypothetical protein